ncbi:MAG: uracil phosphoribosyltransferase [Erysipelotrichaceae bacterium]|jgi:uracil phosphoribosyltransferase|nr:uracil phosphoribosyltransferase [Erysipelotrichaceae bacterium]
MIDISKYTNFHEIDHPLLKHKITKLREKDTKTNEFRQIVKEIAFIEGYEALRDLPTHLREIETPIEKTWQPSISRKKLCFVPILRAGLGMEDGMLELVPGATCGHIGLYRDEETKKPVEYYCKLPGDICDRHVYLIDPMLATGGSAMGAVEILRKHGAQKITFICIIAAPEGVKAFCEAHPDVEVFCGVVDRELNDDAYICPGLGDCGDRTFGTVK